MNSNSPHSEFDEKFSLYLHKYLDQADVTESHADSETLETYLRSNGFTKGMAHFCSSRLPCLRVWLLDNSGSMRIRDGSLLIEDSEQLHEVTGVTRWHELKDKLRYHMNLAAKLKILNVFRLLNDNGCNNGVWKFVVGRDVSPEEIDNDVKRAEVVLERTKPIGTTPAVGHLIEVYEILKDMAPKFNERNKHLNIVLATDGHASDDFGNPTPERTEFINIMKSFAGLPVMFTVLLCTDEDEINEFFSELDKEVGFPLDVLGSYYKESFQVHNVNPWLNYCLPLHHCREMGLRNDILDLIDERPLNRKEIFSFCEILFGADRMVGVPNPDENWEQFMGSIRQLLDTEEEYMSPIKKRNRPLLELGVLNRKYRDKAQCVLM